MFLDGSLLFRDGIRPGCKRRYALAISYPHSYLRFLKGAWYHLTYEVVGSNELSIACTCRQAAYGNCIHIRYFNEQRVGDLDDIDGTFHVFRKDPRAEFCLTEEPPSTICFLQRVLICGSLYSVFSVQSMSAVELRGRAIVTHTGLGRDQGIWKCNKDSGDKCFHIGKAKQQLQEDFGSIPGVGEAVEVERDIKTFPSVCSLGTLPFQFMSAARII